MGPTSGVVFLAYHSHFMDDCTSSLKKCRCHQCFLLPFPFLFSSSQFFKLEGKADRTLSPLTSKTSISALLKSMLRILGRGTPEPSTAVEKIKIVSHSQRGQEVSVSLCKATSICKKTSHFTYASRSLFLQLLSPGLHSITLTCRLNSEPSPRLFGCHLLYEASSTPGQATLGSCCNSWTTPSQKSQNINSPFQRLSPLLDCEFLAGKDGVPSTTQLCGRHRREHRCLLNEGMERRTWGSNKWPPWDVLFAFRLSEARRTCWLMF